MTDLSFLDALGLSETTLPQLPQVRPENLGQRKPSPEAKPQAPQVAPSEKRREEAKPDAPGEGGEQEKTRARQTRYDKVCAMLAEDAGRRYALTTDCGSDAEHVLLTLGVQGVAIMEYEVSKANYDPFRLLELTERHGRQAHK